MIPVTPTEVTSGTTTSSWVDFDLSSFFGASKLSKVAGVVLLFRNTSASEADYGVRPNGSTDATIGTMEDTGQTLHHVGIDALGIIEIYRTNTTNVRAYIIGYYETDNAVFFTNKIDKSIGSTASWVDVDISANTGGDTAVMAFFQVYQSSTGLSNWGLRKNGSTDARLVTAAGTGFVDLRGAQIGVDGSEILEMICNTVASVNLLLTGYAKGSNIVALTNGVSAATATTGSYVDTDVSATVPVGSNGMFYHFFPGGSTGSEYAGDVRRNGDTFASYYDYTGQQYGWVSVDENRVVEQQIESANLDLWIMGYSRSGRIEYLQDAMDTTDTNQYTFASQNLGAADADRYIIVSAVARKAGATFSLSSITVGGITATIVRQLTTTVTNSDAAALVVVRVPTGTTGDIVVTWSTTVLRCAIGVWRAIGLLNNGAADDDDSSGASPPSVSLDVPANGFAIGAALTAAATSNTFTGLDEDDDTTLESFVTYAFGHKELPFGATARTLTATFGTNTEPAGVFASFELGYSVTQTNSARAAEITGTDAHWQIQRREDGGAWGDIEAFIVIEEGGGVYIYTDNDSLTPGSLYEYRVKNLVEDSAWSNIDGETIPGGGGTETNSSRAAEITGSIDVNSARDAEIHGQDSANDSRDAEIHGQASANSVRDAEITGSESADDARDAEITGSQADDDARAAEIHGVDTAEISRDAEITGSDTANDAREAEITGSETANSDREAEIHGVDTSNDARAAEIEGVDGANSARDAEIHGTANANSARDAEITGSQADDDERAAEVTGVDTANDSRDAEIHGTADDNDERDAEITGAQGANSARPAEIAGIATIANARSAEVHGQDSDSDSRDAEITGAISVNDARDAEIHGVDTDTDVRPAEVTGAEPGVDERDAEIHGVDSDSSSRASEITGSQEDNDERSAEITGSIDVTDTRDAEVTGVASSNASRAAEIEGDTAANAERAAEIHGVDTDADARDAEITGSLSDDDSRAAEISGQETDNDSREAEITGAEGADSARGSEISGQITPTDERSAEIHGQDVDNDSRDAEVTGAITSVANRDAEINGVGVGADFRGATIHGYIPQFGIALGVNKNTNTGIGKRRKQVGLNKNTGTKVGVALLR